MTRAAAFDWGQTLPTLDAERVALRALTADDVPALFELFGDAEVTRYWSFPAFESVEQAAALLAEIRGGFAQKTLFQWGIVDRDQPHVIGTCTLYHLDVRHRRAELGFALARRFWGTGRAGQAVARLVAFAFESLGLHRLEADIDPRNEASKRLLLREGFREEGLLRERYHTHGEPEDALLLGLLEREWPRRRVARP